MVAKHPVRFKCPVCGDGITVSYEHRRDDIQCSKCQNIVQAAGFQLLWPEMQQRMKEYRQKRKAAKQRKVKAAAEHKREQEQKRRESEAYLDAKAKTETAGRTQAIEGEVLQPYEQKLPVPSSAHVHTNANIQPSNRGAPYRQVSRTSRQSQSQVVVIEAPRSNVLGVAGFVFSLLGFFSCGVLAPIGLLLSFCGMFSEPKGLATAGLILGFVGSLWLIVGVFILGLIPFLLGLVPFL